MLLAGCPHHEGLRAAFLDDFENLETVLPNMAETSVLAYTIIGRSGSDKVPEGEHDHTWHMMGSRMQRVLLAVERDPYNFELLGTLPGRKLGEVKQSSEIFFSEGARGLRSNDCH